jgi:hypothetical protein
MVIHNESHLSTHPFTGKISATHPFTGKIGADCRLVTVAIEQAASACPLLSPTVLLMFIRTSDSSTIAPTPALWCCRPGCTAAVVAADDAAAATAAAAAAAAATTTRLGFSLRSTAAAAASAIQHRQEVNSNASFQL